jgi:hypothetical protein
MACGVRRMAVCLGCCVVGLAISPVIALGEGSFAERPRPAEATGTPSWESSLLSEVEDLQTLEEAKQASPEAPDPGSSSASPPSSNGSGAARLEDRLVVPGPVLLQTEQLEAERQARLASPAAVTAREESELKYSGLSSQEAATVAQDAFPTLVDEPAGGPPKLPSGESISRFPVPNVAQLKLDSGKHAVIESTEPMALETNAGLVPIDLELKEAGGAFEPITPVIGLRIPKQLADGVGLATTGVSLTPVDGQGSPLGGSTGAVDGTTVLYANTQTDADTVVKPTTSGFKMDTVLRSIHSPQQLYYKVGLPSGASLAQEEEGSGWVRVVDEGTTVAVVATPTASDADGTSVPLSIKVISGDILSVSVAPFDSGQFRLPITVDPSASDPIFASTGGYKTNWTVGGTYKSEYFDPHWEGGEFVDKFSMRHVPAETAGIYYPTRGESQIIRFSGEGEWEDREKHKINETKEEVWGPAGVVNYMVLETKTSPFIEDYDEMPNSTIESGIDGGYACVPEIKCPETTVGTASPENGNTAGYEQVATEWGWECVHSEKEREPKKCEEEEYSHEHKYITNHLKHVFVEIKQEKGPELEFNKTSSTIYNPHTEEYIPNVLYGSNSWLGPHSGAFEVRAKDPGVGLSLYRVLTSGWGDEKYYYDDGECDGIQCPEYDYQGYTYKTGMPNGEDNFEALAEDYVGLYSDIYPQKIKVDATSPHGIKIVGLQNGDELPMGEPHLKVEATDGEGTTKSSGVHSIKVSVEGHEVAGTIASCPEGPCTASTNDP